MAGKKKSELKFSILMGAIAGIAGFFLVGIPTDVIPNDKYTRMIPAGKIEPVLLVAFSILLGIYSGTLIYAYLTRPVVKHRKDMTSTITKGAVGTIGSWFAIACPVCIPLLVSVFGTTALMTYYEPVRPYVGLLSVGLLGFGIYHNYLLITGKCKTCRIEPAVKAKKSKR